MPSMSFRCRPELARAMERMMRDRASQSGGSVLTKTDIINAALEEYLYPFTDGALEPPVFPSDDVSHSGGGPVA